MFTKQGPDLLSSHPRLPPSMAHPTMDTAVTTTTTTGREEVSAAVTTTESAPWEIEKAPTPLPGATTTNSPVEIDYYGLALVFLAPALGGFLYGYDIGATTFVLAMIRSSRDAETWWHHFGMGQQGLLVSSVALGALIGSHIVLVYLSNSIGRRKEIRVAASLYVVGAMITVMSGTILATARPGIGMTTLIAGRILYGAGVGFTMHGAPTYMAEMSPSTVRGTMVSAKATVSVFGIVVGMLMGDLMSDYPDNWTDLYSLEILFAMPMLFLTFKIPRSKRWLLMKGYTEEAKASMQFVYKGDVDDEFRQMADSIGALCCRDGFVEDEDDGTSLASNSVYSGGSHDFAEGLNPRGETRIPRNHQMPPTLDDMHNHESSMDSQSTDDMDDPKLTSRKYRRVITIGLALLVSQQFSGQPSILAYSRVLFEVVGLKGHASVATVVIMGLTSIMTVSLVDRVGRKVLLLCGCALMAVSLLALSVGFWSYDEDYPHLYKWQQRIVLWSMLVFIASFQVGYGPITWTVLSEIYPSEIRGTAMALSVEVNFFFKFVVQLCFPVIQGVLGWKYTFICFACLGFVSFAFILLKVPETKGLSLEEIQMKLRGIPGSQHHTGRNDGPNPPMNERPLASPLLD